MKKKYVINLLVNFLVISSISLAVHAEPKKASFEEQLLQQTNQLTPNDQAQIDPEKEAKRVSEQMQTMSKTIAANPGAAAKASVTNIGLFASIKAIINEIILQTDSLVKLITPGNRSAVDEASLNKISNKLDAERSSLSKFISPSTPDKQTQSPHRPSDSNSKSFSVYK